MMTWNEKMWACNTMLGIKRSESKEFIMFAKRIKTDVYRAMYGRHSKDWILQRIREAEGADWVENIPQKKPMTTKEATIKHQCRDCREGRACWYQEHGGCCVTDGTCSMRCPACGERVWFSGSWDRGNPEDFDCPYCGASCVSPFKGWGEV